MTQKFTEETIAMNQDYGRRRPANWFTGVYYLYCGQWEKCFLGSMAFKQLILKGPPVKRLAAPPYCKSHIQFFLHN